MDFGRRPTHGIPLPICVSPCTKVYRPASDRLRIYCRKRVAKLDLPERLVFKASLNELKPELSYCLGEGDPSVHYFDYPTLAPPIA